MITFLKFVIYTLGLITVAGSLLIAAQGDFVLGISTAVTMAIVTLCGAMVLEFNS